MVGEQDRGRSTIDRDSRLGVRHTIRIRQVGEKQESFCGKGIVDGNGVAVPAAAAAAGLTKFDRRVLASMREMVDAAARCRRRRRMATTTTRVARTPVSRSSSACCWPQPQPLSLLLCVTAIVPGHAFDRGRESATAVGCECSSSSSSSGIGRAQGTGGILL